MTKPWCCFIGCEKDATKEISYNGRDEGIADHDAYTHSCDDHVVELSEGLKEVEVHNLGSK